ncbi:tyrosine-type recombinase/integrase [Sphaerisporangium sp. NPDC049003]|uniref:tyrosine-type recombinase/integrase n=1 Tax=Sphaerisporangium sp. NPDC049003 TaxID=3364517 RepID=UPI0037178EF5
MHVLRSGNLQCHKRGRGLCHPEWACDLDHHVNLAWALTTVRSDRLFSAIAAVEPQVLLRLADEIRAESLNHNVIRHRWCWRVNLEHVVKAEWRPKTLQGYEGVVRRYLVPALGRRRLDKLNAAEVRQFITSLRNGCQCCQRGWDKARETPECCAKKGGACCEYKIQARMVQSIHAVLRNALENAVREEVIARNVAKLVKVSPPKYKVNRGLTVAQAKAILKAARDHRLGALYVLAVCLGLRRGELHGLRWEDVDLEAGTLEVVQTLQRVGGRLQFVKPKTEDSERTVPLPPICLHALKEHRKHQFAERSNCWPDWEDHGLVFPSRRGTPMEPDNLRRSWGEIRGAADLGSVRLHDLRHTCVSLLLDLAVPPHIVREIVGHSDIDVTMKIYAHTSIDEKRKALGKLGDSLSWVKQKRPPTARGAFCVPDTTASTCGFASRSTSRRDQPPKPGQADATI